MKQEHPAIILCAGGGTAGSVVPLVSLLQWRWRVIPEIRKRDCVHWVGVRPDIEKPYLQALPIASYEALRPVKFRRYWDARTLLIPFEMILAVFQAWRILGRVRPRLIWTAGSFIAIPIVWVGWVKGIPALTLQQDVRRGLANRLMEPFSALRLSSLPLEAFPPNVRRRYQYVGTFTRFSPEARAPDAPAVARTWDGSPLVLVLGGSSGAHSLNRLLWETLPKIAALRCTVVHSVGRGEGPHAPRQTNYVPFEHIGEDLGWLYRHASVVISRSGMNAIAECAAFSIPLILVPLANTHQEQNARWVEREKSAIVLEGSRRSSDELFRWIAEGVAGRLKPYGSRLHKLLPCASAPVVAKVIQNLNTR